MKVVWIVNHILKPVAEELGLPVNTSGSWIQSLLNKLEENKEIELFVIIPSNLNKKMIISNVTYLLVESSNIDRFVTPTRGFKKRILKEINEIKPDLIHIHGTEFAYYHSIVSKDKLYPILVSIQGLVSEIIKFNRFESYILNNELNFSNKITNLRLVFSLKIKKYINNFRAKSEIELIKKVDNLIGRTNWDESHVKFLNKNVNYYPIQELMRKEFYDFSWSELNLKKQIIFAAGGFSSPLKGFHFIIFAFHEVLKDFPQAVLYVVGESPFEKDSKSSYEKYLVDIINHFDILDKINFLGFLNAEKMAETFANSSVYVMASSVENSSNTLGEALTIGIPCILPFVGGNSSIVKDNETALFYNYADIPQLVNKIKYSLTSTDKMVSISKDGKQLSAELYDSNKIVNEMLNVYSLISNNK